MMFKDKVNISDFNKQQLLFYYKNIILYYDTIFKQTSKSYSIKKPIFLSYCKENNIKLGTMKPISQYSIEQEENYFYYYNNKKAQVHSLLAHIRNSFAHGNFNKRKEGKYNYLYLYDISVGGKYTGQYTMFAKIRETIFADFIDGLCDLTLNK